MVRVADEIYVRSFRGPTGGWYRQIQQTHQGQIEAGVRTWRVVVDDASPSVRGAVDAAYRAKYGRYGAPYIEPLTSDEVADRSIYLRAFLLRECWPYPEQIEQQPRRALCGPQARSNDGASRCNQVKPAGAPESAQVGAGFLPSWSCEFDLLLIYDRPLSLRDLGL